MIYLDYASTTPVDPRVLEVMMPYLTQHQGNASSIHQFGQRTRRAIDDARNTVIEWLGAFSVHEILFVGSGTESCNMAIFGAAFARQDQGKHIVVSAIEHPAVLEPARYLRDNFGFELTEVAPNEEGLITVEAVEAALRDDTILVSVMMANNEVGTIQPVTELAVLCRERGILFHTDACQAPAYMPVRVDEIQPDLLTINGSKIYGPKGIGLLYVREGVKITPLIHGGGQEFRMRGGTENTANIVGFAKALTLIEETNIAELRDQLLDQLLEIPGVTLNGAREPRLPNNINIHVDGVSGETMVMRLDMEGLAVSSGSACSSGKVEASPVLLAMGQDQAKASESIRISLGRTTTAAEIEEAAETLKRVIEDLSS
jgi:cysteine desulfurase